jgi:hypothetical protein
MAKSKNRGNDIELINNIWVYSDTKEPVANNYKNKPCGYCGKNSTKEGHDGCLGTLRGLMNACCGHGNIEFTYVQFWDGSVIYGEDAKKIQDILKKYDFDINDEDYKNRIKLLELFWQTNKS